MAHLVNQVDQVWETCDVCRAFDKAPHIPIAGSATAPAFNEKVQAALLFLDDLIVARAMDVFSKYSLLHPVQTKFLRNYGAISAQDARGPSDPRSASRWMKGMNGRTNYGRIAARDVELNCNFKVLAPIHGDWRDGMEWPGEFLTIWLKTIAF